MVITPKIRGFICTTAHPEGCAAHVQGQIDYVKSKPRLENAPKRVLVVGASTGYGLASRIVAAFGGGASTVGVFFEKEAADKKPPRPAGIILRRLRKPPRRTDSPRRVSTAMPFPTR